MQNANQNPVETEQLIAELSERLVPINHALNLISQRMERRTLSLESAQESRLIRQLQGCIRSLGLRLTELGASHSILQPIPEVFSIHSVVQTVLNDLQGELDAKFLVVKTDIPLEDTVEADPELVRMAIYLLIRNAIQSCRFDGEIQVSLSMTETIWDLEVADSGPGFDDVFRASWKSSSPEWSRLSREFRHCIAKITQIATCHGGTISLANCSQGGAAISLALPRKAVSGQGQNTSSTNSSSNQSKDAA